MTDVERHFICTALLARLGATGHAPGERHPSRDGGRPCQVGADDLFHQVFHSAVASGLRCPRTSWRSRVPRSRAASPITLAPPGRARWPTPPASPPVRHPVVDLVGVDQRGAVGGRRQHDAHLGDPRVTNQREGPAVGIAASVSVIDAMTTGNAIRFRIAARSAPGSRQGSGLPWSRGKGSVARASERMARRRITGQATGALPGLIA